MEKGIIIFTSLIIAYIISAFLMVGIKTIAIVNCSISNNELACYMAKNLGFW